MKTHSDSDIFDEPKTEAEKINEIEEYYERQLEMMEGDLKQLRASLREQQLEHQTLVTKEQEERNSLAHAEVHVVEISNECQRLTRQLEKLKLANRRLMDDNRGYEDRHSLDQKHIGRLNLELQVAVNKLNTLKQDNDFLKTRNDLLETEIENVQRLEIVNFNEFSIHRCRSTSPQEESHKPIANQDLCKELSRAARPVSETQPELTTAAGYHFLLLIVALVLGLLTGIFLKEE